ncbi:ATP-dependent DNA helicase RecG [Gulosibacter chungangensis]|uniref:Probable DNA 3'-5' helicase RecG n=1 Tax=Gulosibacter chungangensis TaxID=979746 RepID=A0A7J5BBA9_9MICO|nr:ATP-dependent DNA helicase RecG [Gulosibacter chungangensis]
MSKPDAKAVREQLGLDTVGDLISYLPRRHQKPGEHSRTDELEVDEHVTVIADVVSAANHPMRSKSGTRQEIVITDGHGQMTVTFFNQPWRVQQLPRGQRGLFSGKVRFYRGSPQLSHPDCVLLDELDGEAELLEFAKRPMSIYPATSKLQSWRISKLIKNALDYVPTIPDPVPAEFRADRDELDYDSAIRFMHDPDDDYDLGSAMTTLKFTEAFMLQTALLQPRYVAAIVPATPRPVHPGGLREQLDKSLPFELTFDQFTVGETIERELASETPMNRLLQGEVGSGKTLVAVRAMLQAAETGGQSALLAPTEVLANQHLRSITESLGPELSAKLMPTLLTGSLTRAERQKAMLRIVTGDARIIVGTHALLTDTVEFADLSLVVIDEQHRFGVEQRESLRRKGKATPHTLVLTATPIPRTVAMTSFGDLDVSTLRELPAGRAGISTFMVSLATHPTWEKRIWQRTAEELAAGRQAFVVCPSIEPGEPDENGENTDAATASVAQTVQLLRENPVLQGHRIEPLHGRMTAEEKDATMLAFAAGQIDIVVATTVIEVGVNVPNASTMVVLDADRFGVSQLHQLRGRVGRGEHAGVCLLVTKAPPQSLAHERVAAVAATLDGFELAERDLELRREGDVLGTRQSGGKSSLKVLRVTRDAEVIAEARTLAMSLLSIDPELKTVPQLRAAIKRLSGSELAHLEMG